MPAARDLAIAGVFVLLGLVPLPGIDRISQDDRPVDAGAVLLVLVATAALGFRRLWPVTVLLVSAATASAYLLLGYPHGPVIFAVALAVLTAARHCPPPLSAVASLGAYGGLLAGPATSPRRHRWRGRRARGHGVGGDPVHDRGGPAAGRRGARARARRRRPAAGRQRAAPDRAGGARRGGPRAGRDQDAGRHRPARRAGAGGGRADGDQPGEPRGAGGAPDHAEHRAPKGGGDPRPRPAWPGWQSCAPGSRRRARTST